MSRKVVVTNQKTKETGKRKLRIVDPPAMILSVAVAAVTLVLAGLSGYSGFDRHWYGDVLTTLDCIVCLLAVLNGWFTFSVGIRVTDGVAYLGRDKQGNRIEFEASLVRDITVADSDGNRMDPEARHWKNAHLRFHLTDGTARDFRASTLLTRRQYRAARAFFGLR